MRPPKRPVLAVQFVPAALQAADDSPAGLPMPRSRYRPRPRFGVTRPPPSNQSPSWVPNRWLIGTSLAIPVVASTVVPSALPVGIENPTPNEPQNGMSRGIPWRCGGGYAGGPYGGGP